MKFEEMITCLRQGKKVRNICWCSGVFIYINGGVVSFNNGAVYSYLFHVDNINAEWVVLETRLSDLSEGDEFTLPTSCGHEVIWQLVSVKSGKTVYTTHNSQKYVMDTRNGNIIRMDKDRVVSIYKEGTSD